MSNEQIASFLNTYSEEIESDNAAIFAGAGLSRPAGFVDWKMLLKSVAVSLGLDVEKESNLVAIGASHQFGDRVRDRRFDLLLVDNIY